MKKFDIALSFLARAIHELNGMELTGNTPGQCLHPKADGTPCEDCQEILKQIKTQKEDISSAIQHLKIG